MVDRTARLDTPARWDAALDRALTEKVRIYRDLATGDFSALASDGRTLYSVSYYACGCKAGQGADPVCKHRAAFRAHLLREDAALEAEIVPVVPAPVAAPVMCTSCLGTGWARMYLSGRLNDYTELPCQCGAGVPVVETAYQAAV